MTDMDLELRMQLTRARPELSLSHADSLIRGVASSFLNVRDDALACGETEHQDFVTFSHVDGVALVAVFRKAAVHFYTFAADESFIHDSEHLAMTQVQELLQLAHSRHHVAAAALVFAMAHPLPWMDNHRKARKD